MRLAIRICTKIVANTIAFFVFSNFAMATNTPCSGSKGGISHCNGQSFICNDGSTSQSKKNCQAVFRSGNDANDSGDKPEKK